jgi:hypothetical protein
MAVEFGLPDHVVLIGKEGNGGRNGKGHDRHPGGHLGNRDRVAQPFRRMNDQEKSGAGNKGRLGQAGQEFGLAMAEAVVSSAGLRDRRTATRLMVDAAASMRESTMEAMTLREPVSIQASSLAQMSRTATVTEAWVALFNSTAAGGPVDFIGFVRFPLQKGKSADDRNDVADRRDARPAMKKG